MQASNKNSTTTALKSATSTFPLEYLQESSSTGSPIPAAAAAKKKPSCRKKQSREVLNALEKDRMSKITQQIHHLKAVLHKSGISCKASKISILESTNEYIAQLEEKIRKQDLECHKLMEKLNNQNDTSMEVGQLPTLFNPKSSLLSQESMDHSLLFDEAPVAQSVAGLDGNFLRVNKAFEKFSGYKQAELLQLSFFNLTSPHEMPEMFALVSEMFTSTTTLSKQFWKYCLMKSGIHHVYVSMSLIRNPTDASPLYFHCMILPDPAEDVEKKQQFISYLSSSTENSSSTVSSPESLANSPVEDQRLESDCRNITDAEAPCSSLETMSSF